MRLPTERLPIAGPERLPVPMRLPTARLPIAGLGLLGTGGAGKKGLAERLPIARPPGLGLLVRDINL